MTVQGSGKSQLSWNFVCSGITKTGNQSISRLGSRTLHRASQAPHQLQRFQKASVACSILQHLAAVSKTDAMMIHFTKEKMTKPSLTMIP